MLLGALGTIRMYKKQPRPSTQEALLDWLAYTSEGYTRKVKKFQEQMNSTEYNSGNYPIAELPIRAIEEIKNISRFVQERRTNELENSERPGLKLNPPSEALFASYPTSSTHGDLKPFEEASSSLPTSKLQKLSSLSRILGNPLMLPAPKLNDKYQSVDSSSDEQSEKGIVDLTLVENSSTSSFKSSSSEDIIDLLSLSEPPKIMKTEREINTESPVKIKSQQASQSKVVEHANDLKEQVEPERLAAKRISASEVPVSVMGKKLPCFPKVDRTRTRIFFSKRSLADSVGDEVHVVSKQLAEENRKRPRRTGDRQLKADFARPPRPILYARPPPPILSKSKSLHIPDSKKHYFKRVPKRNSRKRPNRPVPNPPEWMTRSKLCFDKVCIPSPESTLPRKIS